MTTESRTFRISPGQVVVYYAFSVCAMALDYTGLALLIHAGIAVPVAAGASFLSGAVFHFSANRWLNFKAFHRAAAVQARTYFAIVGVAWVITVVTIYVVHDRLGQPWPAAKVLATAITLPIGFLGHRFLTFNAGVRAGLRSLAARTRARRHARLAPEAALRDQE